MTSPQLDNESPYWLREVLTILAEATAEREPTEVRETSLLEHLSVPPKESGKLRDVEKSLSHN